MSIPEQQQPNRYSKLPPVNTERPAVAAARAAYEEWRRYLLLDEDPDEMSDIPFDDLGQRSAEEWARLCVAMDALGQALAEEERA